jgi:transposase InsO family protein
MIEAYDSLLTGHLGKNTLYGIIARKYYWPGMSMDVRRFISYCEVCRSSQVWKEKRWGLLKSLPIPNRIWREILMDFITKLLVSDRYTNLLMIVDRLGKGVVLILLKDITTEAVAWAFIQFFMPDYGLPEGIISDWGPQFVSLIWKRICEVLRITRCLSTAWHPKTDSSTERRNSDIKFYFRAFTNYAQNN